MAIEIIIDGQPYDIIPKQKYWKVLQTGYIQSNNNDPDKEFIYSVMKLSNNEVFTIGDNIALSWYETFITPHFIKEFVIRDNEIYCRYGDDNSMWVLGNTRKVTEKEISEAIDNHTKKAIKHHIK